MEFIILKEEYEKLKTFFYHSVSSEQAARMESLRVKAIKLAARILRDSHPSRSQSLALTHLEEATMRAIQSIALEGKAIIPAGLKVEE